MVACFEIKCFRVGAQNCLSQLGAAKTILSVETEA
jgi:hypothetical protein